ncbi:MAG: hypothetical protein LBD73_01920 [Deferribacteraceae bacterium]|jgi:hypothetical protein|nr:hypothetical protein [Deferribacteraceae bacterium]
MKKLALVVFLALFILACQKQGQYQYVETKDGRDFFLNSGEGKVVYVDKSNRIIDYVDLSLSLDEVARIKKEKALNDSSQKYRSFNESQIAGTDYSAEIRTRFYSDRLLYKVTVSPYREDLNRNSSNISFQFTDVAGFTLESVEPKGWTRIVDDNGTPVALETNGRIPMTLENYLEIASRGLLWREWKK